MSAKGKSEQSDGIRAMEQNKTRCRILGVDKKGRQHIHDTDRDKIVALDEDGIVEQYDLSTMDKDAEDWMDYVEDRVGWRKEQWLGHRWRKVFRRTFHG